MLFAPVHPASGAVFTLAPGSSLALSGSIAIDITVGGLTFPPLSSDLAPQGAGSLIANLAGTVNAVSDGTTLTFPGGSSIALVDSGSWQPSGLPAAFALQAQFLFDDPVFGSGRIELVGAVRNLVYDLTGSAPLTGSPGSQSFNTAGLALDTISGRWDGALTLCNPDCDVPNPFSDDLSGPPSTILDAGSGSFAFDGATQTLFFPIVFSSTETATDAEEGITVTVRGIITLVGSAEASAPIPEPSIWVLLLVGAVGMFGMGWLRRSVRVAARGRLT